MAKLRRVLSGQPVAGLKSAYRLRSDLATYQDRATDRRPELNAARAKAQTGKRKNAADLQVAADLYEENARRIEPLFVRAPA